MCGHLFKHQRVSKYYENDCISRPFFVFNKALYEIKESGLQLSFNIFR